MNVYFYFGEQWLDSDYSPVAETDGIDLGKSAWFLTTSAKSITTAGQVRKENFTHTFTETSQLVVSAFPGAFYPNSANVSWGINNETQIQTPYVDDDGLTQMNVFFYFGEWMDSDYSTIAADYAVAQSGDGFWLLMSDASETFSEVSPLADPE